MGQDMTLLIFLLQALLLSIYIPLSYIGYKSIRAPQKSEQVKKDLELLGEDTKNLDEVLSNEYQLRHYFWPLFFAFLLTFGIYTVTHPYAIEHGWWAGVLEETIDIFGPSNPFPRASVAGRFLFWGWMGAYIYSVHLTFRRFMTYDLTPSVYIFTSNRFFLAMTVGSIAGIGVGTFATRAGFSFDVSLMMVSIVTFVIGFFPEQGVNWLTTMAGKIMKKEWKMENERPLSEIDGLNIWQQGRLNQEGIESVQNLATTNIRTIVINTPFTIYQIVDWVDQAILQLFIDKKQLGALKTMGLRSASAVLKATDDNHLMHLVQALSNKDAEQGGLTEAELRMLHMAIQSAPNIKPVSSFWQALNGEVSSQMFDKTNNKPGKQQAETESVPEPKETAAESQSGSSEPLESAATSTPLPSGHPLQSQLDETNHGQLQPASFSLPGLGGSADDLVGKQFGHYRLEALLKNGSSTSSYRGVDVSQQHSIIFKVIRPPQTNPNYKQDFKAKAEALAQLEHPHIVELYDYGRTGELLSAVMPYVEGDTLDSLLVTYHKNKDLVSPLFAYRIIKAVGEALDYAHSRDVYHYNVTPSDIILNHKNHAFLTNFVLLPDLEHSPDQLINRLRYLAPEQIRCLADTVPQSELYSLGVILYEMLTGKVPFDDVSPTAIALQHINCSPPLPRNINPGLNAATEMVLLKALNKSPQNRYQTGQDLTKAFEAAILLMPETSGPKRDAARSPALTSSVVDDH
jgi:serine/threonine protein kinase